MNEEVSSLNLSGSPTSTPTSSPQGLLSRKPLPCFKGHPGSSQPGVLLLPGCLHREAGLCPQHLAVEPSIPSLQLPGLPVGMFLVSFFGTERTLLLGPEEAVTPSSPLMRVSGRDSGRTVSGMGRDPSGCTVVSDRGRATDVSLTPPEALQGSGPPHPEPAGDSHMLTGR